MQWVSDEENGLKINPTITVIDANLVEYAGHYFGCNYHTLSDNYAQKGLKIIRPIDAKELRTLLSFERDSIKYHYKQAELLHYLQVL